MKHGYVKSTMSVLTIIAAAAIITLSSATPLRAQIGGGSVGGGPGLSGRDRDINNREAEMAANEKQGRPAAKRDPQMIMAEVNEDFDRLRAIDEEMQTTLKADLDYKQVAQTSAEVKKRATRLKTNLNLPAGKDEKRQKMEDPGADLKPSVAMLEGLIKSFITNPIFTDTGGLDTQLAGKAKRDLESIIELSEKVRKSAEKMSKNAGKS